MIWVAVADLASDAAAALGWPAVVACIIPTTALMLVYHELTDI